MYPVSIYNKASFTKFLDIRKYFVIEDIVICLTRDLKQSETIQLVRLPMNIIDLSFRVMVSYGIIPTLLRDLLFRFLARYTRSNLYLI